MNAPTDRRTDRGRLCDTCGFTIIPFGAASYRHQTPPADGHRAEPRLAHAMDVDPFGGIPGADEE